MLPSDPNQDAARLFDERVREFQHGLRLTALVALPATILIALGAFIPGVTSGLNRFGVTWSFYLGEFLGVLLIFAGFLVSEEVFKNIRIGGTIWSRAAPEPARATEAGTQTS